MEFGANSGKFPGNFGKIQGSSVGFCMALSMKFSGNSWGISGHTLDFRENLGFGVVSDDLGGQKAFAQIAKTKHHSKSPKCASKTRDVSTQNAGRPGHSVSKTREKGALHTLRPDKITQTIRNCFV